MFIYKNITYNKEEYNEKIFYRTDDIQCAKNKLFSSIEGIHYYIDSYLKKINSVDKDNEYYQSQLAIYNYHKKHRTKFITVIMNNYGVSFFCQVNNKRGRFYYSSRSFLDVKSKLEKYLAQQKDKQKKTNFQLEFLHENKSTSSNNTHYNKLLNQVIQKTTTENIKTKEVESTSNCNDEFSALKNQLLVKLDKIKKSNNISPINKVKRITAIKEELKKISM